MRKSLSKLVKVNLRDIFENETQSFSTWLSQKENLDLLGDEIGIDINFLQSEASVGKFKVDILAEETDSDNKIVIENQLESTNHDHLGKIITYASGYDAKIIIWIVKEVRNEHKKAIEWLNEHTVENISFFLIKIELWQIEKSEPAPKFEVIVRPNEWVKAIKTNSSNRELSNTRLQHLDFWDKFKNYLLEKDVNTRLRATSPQSWYHISIGFSELHIAINLDSQKKIIVCGLYISKNKDLYHFLLKKKDKIEKEIGESIEWIDAAITSKLKIKKKVNDIYSPTDIEKNFDWLYQKIKIFKKVIPRYINEFRGIER